MKNALIVLFLTALTSCVPSAPVEGEASSGNINSNAPYLWGPNVFPRELRISTSFSAAEVANITSMSSAWETGVVNTNFFTHNSTTSEVSSPSLNMDNLGDDNVLGIYKIQHWPNALPGSALAVTQLFGRRYNVGGDNEYVRIEHADILINDNLYNFYTGATGDGWEFDLKTVVLHEMGHFLGLNHRASTSNSVMIPSINPGATNRAPTSIDVNDLASKYGISLGGGAGHAMALAQKSYKPNIGDPGKQIKILIELHADGECVHKENGTIIRHHPLSE